MITGVGVYMNVFLVHTLYFRMVRDLVSLDIFFDSSVRAANMHWGPFSKEDNYIAHGCLKDGESYKVKFND